MSWQDDLIKKEKELNLKKEENHVRDRSNNRNNSNSSISVWTLSIGNQVSPKRKQNITHNERRNISMISAEAAKGDLEKLIAEAKGVTVLGIATVLVLKGILVAIKVILTARTNTVRIMDKLGIPREEEKKINTTKDEPQK